MIPQDLLVEILSRLPVKTLARCVCVSKLWATIIRSRNFIISYESRSSFREPCLLFALCDTMTTRWHLFTFQETPSSATYYTTQSLKPHCVNGLIYYEGVNQLWICNPLSGKIIPLPQTNPNKSIWAWYLGYDPINYQYKVLSFSKNNHIYHPYKVDQLEVFTLGDEGSWKMIKDMNVEIPLTKGICLNGILYYGAHTAHGLKFLRFDVRTEKFGDFIDIPLEVLDMHGLNFTFMNYQGKLYLVTRKGRSFREYDLWIFEGVEKQEWSKVSIYITLEMYEFYIVELAVVGCVVETGEIIIIVRDVYDHLQVVYVDLKKNRSRKVEFQRIGYSKIYVFAFTNYVESLMFW